jgi:hypothetical protein
MRRALLMAGLLLACDRAEPKPYTLQRAQFGVFFGGEVQELTRVPLETDRARQTIGIRLVFRAPSPTPLKVHWELARPRGTRSKSKDDDQDAGPVAPKPSESLVEFGDVATRPGEDTLDIPLLLRPGDPLGDWSVKVTVEGEQVLNRPFRVVKPSQRKAADND